jgi:magnesium chelatase family protein
MLVKVFSAALLGIEAYLVEVEVDISTGLPGVVTVGLPDAAIRESKERVRAALKNCGFEFPSRKLTINLAPADRRKEGSAYDLPISLGLLAFLGVVPAEGLRDFLFLGEVALDGRLKPCRGVLPAALLAQQIGFRAIVVPKENEGEAALVRGLEIYGLENLVRVIRLLREPGSIAPAVNSLDEILAPAPYDGDFAEVKGQQHAKRALEVAAAGAHNILLIGPPGAGKTMLARRLPSILPPMTFDEMIEVTQIYSSGGLLRGRAAICARPFRAPHHTITDAGLVGGGVIPRPGEVSLAHNGVLFMDELPEFRRHVLEDLRQPLEDGRVVVSRSAMSLTFPSSFMLVAAMNPWACVAQLPSF